MRGDRPFQHYTDIAPPMAPPRARGSTDQPSFITPLLPGSPACAGIDPSSSSSSICFSRLPRVRGDRPLQYFQPSPTHLAPPRARGSTPNTYALYAGATGSRARGSTGKRENTKEGRKGSPACAGIDLDSVKTYSVSSWLPRVRGDRPLKWNTFTAWARAPPRARGSTSN